MGGRAFARLHCPRISQDLYLKTRTKITEALQSFFVYVVVPTELPEKPDHGDVDFLVSEFIHKSSDGPLDWTKMVSMTKNAMDTPHGRRGHYDPSIMHFAVPSGETDGDCGEKWIQIDVKVCETPGQQSFQWRQFLLNYASGIKMLASPAKPLGLTINPDGIHIRVEEMEETNFPGSMVFLSKEPKDVLAIMGLDWKFLWGGFESREELYSYIASSWIFHPAHFQKRLEDEKYLEHHQGRSAAWVPFITEWIPQRYPNYAYPDDDMTLEQWSKETRVAVRNKVFTLFPHVTTEYYTKRKAHLKELEEHRLRELLMAAIPTVTESHVVDFPEPRIIIQSAILPSTVSLDDDTKGNTASLCVPSPPPSPPLSTTASDKNPLHLTLQNDVQVAPLDALYLPREPPLSFGFRPPASNMSCAAKLLCLARWTRFCDKTGSPYLGSEPREKKFEMFWSDSIMGDDALVQWVEKAWAAAWWRQCCVNYVGMWKMRFEKEDKKALKAAEAALESQTENNK